MGEIMQELRKLTFKSDEYKEQITFCIQRLDELLFAYTKDSFKPPIFNVKMLFKSIYLLIQG